MTAAEKRHAVRAANKALRFKLSMERRFIPELKSYFYQQYRRVRNGDLVDPIAPVLEKHYRRIIRELTGVHLKQEDPFGLSDALELMLFGHAEKQGELIDSTTAKKLKRAEELARRDLADSGIPMPTQSQLDDAISKVFRRLNRPRPQGIATTETQEITEATTRLKEKTAEDMMREAIVEGDKGLAQKAAKVSESRTIQDVAKQVGTEQPPFLFEAIALMRKMWVTMGDSKVRVKHARANFQIRPINEPFIVGEELLMVPGDTSLGASLDNVAGCRCHASYL